MSVRRVIHRLVLILVTFEKTIIYTLLFVSLLAIALLVSGIDLTLQNISLILSLNYEPKNEMEAFTLLFTFFLELSPIMAFVEVHTLSLEERSEKMAKRLENHVIIVGAGHLGKRIIERLMGMGIKFCLVVLPEDKEGNELVLKLLKMGMPIVFGHATVEETLIKAGLKKAKAIIIAINDDATNMIIAERAKKINPSVRTVVRIFNDALAELALKSGFADEVLSTTAIAVDTYIIGAFLNVNQEIKAPLAIVVEKDSWLVNKKVSEVEKATGVTILAIQRDKKWIRVSDESLIRENDSIIIYGEPEKVGKLLAVMKK